MKLMAYVGATIGILLGVTGTVVGLLGVRARRGRDTGQLRAVLRVASVVCLILAVGGGITRLAVPTEPVYLLAEILWFAGALGLGIMAFASLSREGNGRAHTHYLAVALMSGLLLLALGAHGYSTGEDWGRAVRELIWGGILLTNSSIFLFVSKLMIERHPVK